MTTSTHFVGSTHTPAVLGQLLDRLASDDDFRSRLVEDPVSALHDMGIDADAADLPAHPHLPSKAVIMANREALLSKPGETGREVYFFLDGKS